MKKFIIKTAVLCSLLSASVLYAGERDTLQQDISIYGWLPSLNGTLKFKVPGEAEESADANAIDSLDAVFMGSYAVHKNEWSFLADLIYLKMSGDTEGLNPNVNYNLELRAKLFGLYGGYTLFDANNMRVDAIAGMRYFSLGLDVERSGGNILNATVSADVNNYDAVIGIRGEYTIDAHWYVPYQFDIGAGDSDLTWQANASVAYKFGWGDVIATYRYIHYDKGDSPLLEEFNLYGPKLGVVFHF